MMKHDPRTCTEVYSKDSVRISALEKSANCLVNEFRLLMKRMGRVRFFWMVGEGSFTGPLFNRAVCHKNHDRRDGFPPIPAARRLEAVLYLAGSPTSTARGFCGRENDRAWNLALSNGNLRRKRKKKDVNSRFSRVAEGVAPDPDAGHSRPVPQKPRF